MLNISRKKVVSYVAGMTGVMAASTYAGLSSTILAVCNASVEKDINIKIKSLIWSLFAVPVMIILFGMSSSCAMDKYNKIPYELKVLDLKSEYATNPIGLDVRAPQLSWRIESEKRGVQQKAYQILVADSLKELSQGDAVIWDSGKTNSSKLVAISYNGKELVSRKRYFWKVRIWDFDNKVSEWSEPFFFEMGLLNQEDWKADWVGYTPSWTGRPLYFERIFNIEKEVLKARAYVSGLGYYELTINEQKVGDHVLDPAQSSYDKRVYYTTYDIIDYLKRQNVLVVIVGSGWYGTPKLRMQIEITYTDGTNDLITSNEIRNVTAGPIVKSSIYDGEFYDAREEFPEVFLPIEPWSQKNNEWEFAQIADPPGGKMVSQKIDPIRITDIIIPQIIKEPVPQIYVLDVGQNVAGWASLKVKGEKGTKITLKFAETLYDDGTVNQENLRTTKAVNNRIANDIYILKGEGEEQWEPAFTYHGFRYIQVEGFPYPPKNGDIQVKVVRSSVKPVGKFSCSNELLNRIHKMVVTTETSNLHSIPTDCSQRVERMGWLNDLTVRIEQELYNFDFSRFYPKFIDDIKDDQGEDGAITDTAPFRYGNRPADPVSASYLLLALESYRFYGNEKIIHEHYEGLKAWVDFLNSRTDNGIVNYSYYGDWSPPIAFGAACWGAVSKSTPGELMSTGYLYYCSKMLSQMASLEKNKGDENKYKNLAEKTAEAFNKKYWNEQTGGYASNNQACNSFALFLGLVNKERLPRVIENLVNDVKKQDYHLTTGNLCSKYLLEMLTEHGYPEVAYKIVTQETYPSWGYMLANGATTLWERWENETGSAMNSHNHPMLGSVDSWFYKYILGIVPDINHPGFEGFDIRPYIFKDLTYAEGEITSIRGIIKSFWRKEAGYIYFNVTIPENSIATIYVPTKNVESITESNRDANRVDQIKFLNMQDDYAVFRIGSGTYHFKSVWYDS